MDMIERVARALSDGGHLGVSLAFSSPRPGDVGSVPQLRARDTERALAAARAAIGAMRMPTGAMEDAGLDANPRGRTITDSDLRIMFAAMMVAALTPSDAKAG